LCVLTASRHRRLTHLAATVPLWLLAVAIVVACGGSDAGTEAPATLKGTGSASAGEDLNLAVEQDKDPVFWRTIDRFQSLEAGTPYKVVLRVTNGYHEEMLRIVAEKAPAGSRVEFEAVLAAPAGPDDPGSFYVFSLELPEAGPWRLTAFAGEDEAAVDVEAGPATSPADGVP
jgi:hypothetical protein